MRIEGLVIKIYQHDINVSQYLFKGNKKNNNKAIANKNDVSSEQVLPLEDSSINRYCKCSEAFCNCCRDFALPLVKLDGPGKKILWFICSYVTQN